LVKRPIGKKGKRGGEKAAGERGAAACGKKELKVWAIGLGEFGVLSQGRHAAEKRGRIAPTSKSGRRELCDASWDC